MVGIGIIGAGRMGNAHAGNLQLVKDAKVVAVYDISDEKADAFVEKYPGVKKYGSARELAEASDVDLVVVTSPTYVHEEGVRAAMRAKKDIFCEKPLCRTREQLAELSFYIREYPKLFTIGFVRRFAANTLTFKKLLDDGKIGKPLCASVRVNFGGFKREWGDWFADYSKSGGATLDMLAHHCDLVNYMLGKPVSVYARALMMNPKAEKPADFVSATVMCPHDVIVNMECSWLRSGISNNFMFITGDKGTLKLSDSNGVEFYAPGVSEPEKIDLDMALTGQPKEITDAGMYAIELGTLVDCAKAGTASKTGYKDAVDAMDFCLALLKSAETGTIVAL